MQKRILLAGLTLAAASLAPLAPAHAQRIGFTQHGSWLAHRGLVRGGAILHARWQRPVATRAASLRYAAQAAAYAAPAVYASPAAPAGGGMVGQASFYSGGRTASGGMVGTATCAHRSLPFGTRVLVTNLGNARQMVLTVNDRGPFVGGRIVDVSRPAAAALGMLQSGVATIRMEVVGGPG